MKKFGKLFIVAIAFVLALSLTACKKEETKEETKQINYNDYVGSEFSGKDPWGGKLEVKINKIEENKMSWTYTDTLGSGKTEIIVKGNKTNELTDGSTSFAVRGNTEDGKYSYEYHAKLTLQDDKIVIKYTEGALEEKSTEGGSASYQVGPLEAKDKTVTLTKN